MTNKVRRWITKSALTSGVYEAEFVLDKGYIQEVDSDGSRILHGYFGRDGKYAFVTLEEALRDAEDQRYSKVRSLKRRLKTLESMDIEVCSLDERT